MIFEIPHQPWLGFHYQLKILRLSISSSIEPNILNQTNRKYFNILSLTFKSNLMSCEWETLFVTLKSKSMKKKRQCVKSEKSSAFQRWTDIAQMDDAFSVSAKVEHLCSPINFLYQTPPLLLLSYSTNIIIGFSWKQKSVQNIDMCPLFSPSGELYLGLITCIHVKPYLYCWIH